MRRLRRKLTSFESPAVEAARVSGSWSAVRLRRRRYALRLQEVDQIQDTTPRRSCEFWAQQRFALRMLRVGERPTR